MSLGFNCHGTPSFFHSFQIRLRDISVLRMIEQPYGNTRSVCCQRQTLFYKRFEKARMRQCLPLK